MFPEPTELLLIRCSIESIWTPKIQITYIDTKKQLADMLKKGNFTRYERDNLHHCWTSAMSASFAALRISALVAALKSMAKRMQEEKGEERIVAKSRPTLNLAVTVSTSSLSVQNPVASISPGTLRAPCQSDWKSTGRLVAREHN